MAHLPCRWVSTNRYGYPLYGEIMTNINLAPYSVHRFFDGAEVTWILKKDGDPRCAVAIVRNDIISTICQFETRQDAEAERNRLNTAYGLDEIGV